MTNTPKDKHGFWAKALSELYKLAAKELKSPAGRVNILMVIGLIAIIIVYILSSTVTSVARIVASKWNAAFVAQTGDNIIALILAFIIPSALCFLFMKFIIKEEDEE